eukprot:TRINITY_DN11960_c0_g2_i2.p1 TRINITY_DN11960_c0_g2~~TRINITY_DN11960_c0_g2_i2.p1  ORF type:complete len:516 (+),score=123.21 TRINITY_DN11960_c0_g2_i2:1536-3083(+)
MHEYLCATATLRFLGCRVVNIGTVSYGTLCDSLLPPASPSVHKAIWRPIWQPPGSGLTGDGASVMVLRDDAMIERAVELVVYQRTSTPAAVQWCQARRPEDVALTTTPVPVELRDTQRPSFVDFLLWKQSYDAILLPRDGSDAGSKIPLHRCWKQHQVHFKIADIFQCPPAGLRLWVSKSEDQGLWELAKLRVPTHGSGNKPHIYYEKCTGCPDEAVAHSVMVEARNAGGNLLGTRIIVLPDKTQCRMAHLQSEAKSHWPELGVAEEINLIEVDGHVISAVFDSTVRQEDTPWAKSGENWAWRTKLSYRVEPQSQPMHMPSHIVSVCHFWRPENTPGTGIVLFGDPFRLRILESDTAPEVLQRVRKKLGLCAEPVPPPATSAPQRAGGAACLTTRWAQDKSGRVGATSDEEEAELIMLAVMMSMSDKGLAPLDKETPRAAPKDDGTCWQVHLLTKSNPFADWSAGDELGADETVWPRLQSHTGAYQRTIGLQHAPPLAPEGSTTAAGGGVVVRSD